MEKHWRVRAIRSAASAFGAAESFVKSHGTVLRFATEEGARQYAQRVQQSTVSSNLTYVPAGPFDGPPIVPSVTS